MESAKPTAYVAGPLFLDVVLSGLRHAPRPGEEQWVDGLAVTPGGVANQAAALASLGVDARLITAIGTDDVGGLVREQLRKLGVGIAYASHRERQNLTVALVHDGDRSFTTYGTPEVPEIPADLLPPSLFYASLPYLSKVREQVARWRSAGTIVIADAAWDESGRWSESDLACLADADVFVPNDVEAMNYTGAPDARSAAEALTAWCGNVVVTAGEHGALVAGGGAVREIGGIDVDAVDPTGAGDAFAAGLGAGLARGLGVEEAAKVGVVMGSYTVTQLGGSAHRLASDELRRFAGKYDRDGWYVRTTGWLVEVLGA